MRDYLATLDDAAFGAATEVAPKFTSHSDPASQWTAARHGPAFFAYSNNYLIDTDHGIIVDVEASRSIRTAETGAARTMIDRVMDRFGLYPERLIADTAYGSGSMLGWLVEEHGIEPHIPVIDKSDRAHGTFSAREFTYDRKTDAYTCPAGQKLKPYWRDMSRARPEFGKDGFKRYFARRQDCGACPIKSRCTPNQPARKIARSEHEGARQMARDIAKTEEYGVLAQAAKEGRDAVRAPEAHSGARKAQTAGALRRKGRIPPRCNRPEPQEAGQTLPGRSQARNRVTRPRRTIPANRVQRLSRTTFSTEYAQSGTSIIIT